MGRRPGADDTDAATLRRDWLRALIGAGRGGRLGVLVDVDGTISALAPRPEDAVVSERARRALADLARRGAVVGVVSGRGLDDLLALVRVDGLFYSGTHGIEWEHAGVRAHVTGADTVARSLDDLQADLASRLRGVPIRFERKSFALALHYREADDPVAARARIMQALSESPLAGLLRVRDGARVVELLPALNVSKGDVVRHVAERFRLRALVYFGDDVTDADAFRVVRELRVGGGITGVAVAALHAETAREALAVADTTVPAVDGVIAALEAIAEGIGRGRPSPGPPGHPLPHGGRGIGPHGFGRE